MKMSLFIGVMRCMRKDIQKFANQALKNLEMDPKEHVFMKRMNTPWEKQFYRDVWPLAQDPEFIKKMQEMDKEWSEANSPSPINEETPQEEQGSNSPGR